MVSCRDIDSFLDWLRINLFLVSEKGTVDGRFSSDAENEFPVPPCWVCDNKHANRGPCTAYKDGIPIESCS